VGHFWTRNWSYIAFHLVVTRTIMLLYLFFSSCWGVALQKSLRPRRVKSDRDEVWQDCSSRKYASIHWVEFSILRQTLKMANTASIHAVLPPDKCTRSVCPASPASAFCCISVRQLPAVYSFWSIVYCTCFWDGVYFVPHWLTVVGSEFIRWLLMVALHSFCILLCF